MSDGDNRVSNATLYANYDAYQAGVKSSSKTGKRVRKSLMRLVTEVEHCFDGDFCVFDIL